MLDQATTLLSELRKAVEQDRPIILVAPQESVLGCRGKILGELLTKEFTVEFSAGQAARMADRIDAAMAAEAPTGTE